MRIIITHFSPQTLPFELHISNYFKHKVWFSDLCDIMPLAIANSFGIKIVILRPSRQSQYIEIFQLNVPIPTPYIILYLNHDHYSGTIPSQCLLTNTAFMMSSTCCATSCTTMPPSYSSVINVSAGAAALTWTLPIYSTVPNSSAFYGGLPMSPTCCTPLSGNRPSPCRSLATGSLPMSSSCSAPPINGLSTSSLCQPPPDISQSVKLNSYDCSIAPLDLFSHDSVKKWNLPYYSNITVMHCNCRGLLGTKGTIFCTE